MTDTTLPSEAPEVDDVREVFSDTGAFRDALEDLDRQSHAILALRTFRRADVFQRHRVAVAECVCAGIEIPSSYSFGRAPDFGDDCADDIATAIATTARNASAVATNSHNFAHSTSTAAAGVWKAASDDFARLLQLQRAQLPLTGWDDPRLGPLWPEGAPEWHKQLEREVTEMRAKLDARPDPFAPPIPDAARTQFDDLRKLNEMVASGELAEYSGEFVLLHRGRVVGHGEDLAAARLKASEEHGLPFSAMVHRYIY